MASKDVQQDLMYVYGWNYYTMKIMGTWPNERRWKQPSSYLVLIPVLMMLCFICGPQTANLFLIWGDFNLVVENLSLGNITITISLLKTIAFWINGKTLKSLLKCMAKDWNSQMNREERDTMMGFARVTRTTIIRSTVFCHSVVIIYILVRYSTIRYTGYAILFRAYFPYNETVSPNYELTLVGQLVGAFYAATTYTAVDTFVAMLIFHVCGQLTNLQQEIRSLKGDDMEQLRIKLKKIVEKHEYINNFAEKVESCFNMMLLLQMLGCTVQLCFQIFQAIMSLHGDDKEYMAFQMVFLLAYIVYVLVQLYLYCYVGERLSVESTDIAKAAFDCEWYNLSGKNAKFLVIIMCRAKLPLRITAGRFCSFTLELYSQILKTSMSYISVLYAMTDK